MSPDPYKTAGHIRRNLHRITDYYDAALNPGRHEDQNASRATTDSGEPANLHAIDTRQAARRCLAYWCTFTIDELPDGPGTGPRGSGTIHDLTRFVDTWALAIAEQAPDDAANLEQETAKHGNALESIAKGWTSKRIQIPGRCPELNFVISAQGIEELVPCEGELWSTFREEDNGLLPRSIVCDRDSGHEWQPHDWAHLGRRIGTFAEGLSG